jgi:hypothetical protein
MCHDRKPFDRLCRQTPGFPCRLKEVRPQSDARERPEGLDVKD